MTTPRTDDLDFDLDTSNGRDDLDDLGDLESLLTMESVPQQPQNTWDLVEAGASSARRTTEGVAAASKPLDEIRSRSIRDTLYLDIETVSDFDRLKSFDLDPLPELPPECSADSLLDPAEFITQDLAAAKKSCDGKNLPEAWLVAAEEAERASKKPRKGLFDLIESCRDWKVEVGNAAAERIKLLSVTPEYCKIIAVGWATGSGEVQSLVVGQPGRTPQSAPLDEYMLLCSLWAIIESAGPLCGFNALHFDLPVILFRSSFLGVPSTRLLNLSPYSQTDVIDLARVRFGGSIPKGMGLKRLAKLHGIPVPAGDCDGSQVNELFQSGRLDKIGEYVRSDVTVTRELHRRMQGYFCC